MAQVTLEVHGKRYAIACDDGQEEHLRRLAAYVDERVKELASPGHNTASDAQLLLMAALVVTDELADTFEELERLKAQPPSDPAVDEAARVMERAARQIEMVAGRLAAS